MRPKTLLACCFALPVLSVGFAHDTNTSPSSKRSLVEPVLSASTYDSRKEAIEQFSSELAKTNPGFAVSTFGNKVDEASSLAAKVDKSAKFIVVIDNLRSDLSVPKATYSKREFASIPTHVGSAKIELFDVSLGKVVGIVEATSAPETSASPAEPTRVMKNALLAALSKYFSHSK